MWNFTLDESQAGIKISGRNINNLRYVYDTSNVYVYVYVYVYDTTLMAESKEQLKNLVVKVKKLAWTQHWKS